VQLRPTARARTLDLAVAVCYCVAASVCGFGQPDWLATFAMCFWAIGSALLLPEPLHAWLATRRGAGRESLASARYTGRGEPSVCADRDGEITARRRSSELAPATARTYGGRSERVHALPPLLLLPLLQGP
jgi:hypothetical protein